MVFLTKSMTKAVN